MTHVRTAQTDLTHDVEAPRVGRRFVTSVLAKWGIASGAVERAQLLVSELISNAVLHGAGPVRLMLAEVEGGRSVRIEVCNRGSGQPRMRVAHPDDLSGRGLQLVDQLSRGWGSSNVDGETSVWFEVQIDASA
ncbi:MAG: ATP-binding protein [Ilumatobacteraceae bacterium]|nr:ATP-binding protein [Ilumatobacteraceae bacterium]MCU1390155.1 ATP-binding protein [Ilumatobacteraceae bacterium]